jgi:hypothetical protein
MRLLPEQEELLMTLVEAARNVPRTEQFFQLLTVPAGFGDRGPSSGIEGCGLRGVSVLRDDIVTLADFRLLTLSRVSRDIDQFSITADGFAHYEAVHGRAEETAIAIEEDVSRYLDSQPFRSRFASAYERLAAAQALLWGSNSPDDLTTIGHKLREALQQFATTMVEIHQPEAVDSDPARTKNRLGAVIDQHRSELGERGSALLDALVIYLDAVNGIDQRLEHADQKGHEPATWEDGRTAVFQTAMLMFEFDRVLNR